jgi:arylsulfatase A-like enzyme
MVPNILLFFPDELRYDWGGLHSNPYYARDELPLFLPHFDEIARNGTRFTRAFVGAPVCAPSRACLASGRQYDQNTVPENFHNDFDVGSVETFYKLLRDTAGFHTMVAGRDDLDKSSGGPGDGGGKHTEALGFSDSYRCDGSTDVTSGGTPHEPYGFFLQSQPVTNASIANKYNSSDLFELQAARYREISQRHVAFSSYAIPDPMPLPDEGYQDNWIGARVVDLLTRRPMGKPFFIEASHQAPHPPMDITAGMAASHDLRGRTFPNATMCGAPQPPQALMAISRQNYAAKIERLDFWLGRYISLLESQGALENTIICIASGGCMT